MVDKIEVTVHVSINGISPQLDLPQTLADVTHPGDLSSRCDRCNIFSEDQPRKRLKVSRRKVTTYHDPDLIFEYRGKQADVRMLFPFTLDHGHILLTNLLD